MGERRRRGGAESAKTKTEVFEGIVMPIVLYPCNARWRVDVLEVKSFRTAPEK